MSLECKKNAKYHIICPTSMGVRITPEDRQPVHTSDHYIMQATSAESNVLTVGASLGLSTKVLTTFVKGNPIAQFIKNDLRKRNIKYEGKDIEQEGPWGYRHQFNIADSGFGMRGPRVQNDRAGEVGRTLSIEDFDIQRIFKEEGVCILHLSGLIAALSPKTGNFCLELARAAKQNGTIVSFDLNHRASFWINREDELSEVFTEIAHASDILIGNEEDFQLALGIKGPKAGGEELGEKIDSFKTMIKTVQLKFKETKLFATTLREVLSSNEHLWGALLYDGEEFCVAEPRSIQVLDRIGGGDGFVGGLLYGIISGFSNQESLHFGWATGAMATSMLYDYAIPTDEQQVWSVWQGNARVKR